MLPKLVRDKIPGVLETAEKYYKAHVADSTELNIRLHEKMNEEVSEFFETPCLDEAADIYEVFLAVLKNWKMTLPDVELIAKIKRESRGAFEHGIILDEVLDDDGV